VPGIGHPSAPCWGSGGGGGGLEPPLGRAGQESGSDAGRAGQGVSFEPKSWLAGWASPRASAAGAGITGASLRSPCWVWSLWPEQPGCQNPGVLGRQRGHGAAVPGARRDACAGTAPVPQQRWEPTRSRLRFPGSSRADPSQAPVQTPRVAQPRLGSRCPWHGAAGTPHPPPSPQVGSAGCSRGRRPSAP